MLYARARAHACIYLCTYACKYACLYTYESTYMCKDRPNTCATHPPKCFSSVCACKKRRLCAHPLLQTPANTHTTRQMN